MVSDKILTQINWNVFENNALSKFALGSINNSLELFTNMNMLSENGYDVHELQVFKYDEILIEHYHAIAKMKTRLRRKDILNKLI